MARAKFRKVYRQPVSKPKTEEEKKGEEPYRGGSKPSNTKDNDSSK